MTETSPSGPEVMPGAGGGLPGGLLGAAPPPLPALREDLSIVEGAPSASGARTWLIHDPLQHRYIQIDAATRDLMSLWRPGATLPEMATLARESLGLWVEDAEIVRIVEFVRANDLVVESKPGHWRDIAERARRGRHSLASRLLHNYLFFRVPLVKPQRFLVATLPFVAPVYTRAFMMLVIGLGLAGLYLVSRQWEAFLGTFHAFFTLEGAAAFALALLLIKALHELGHAYTAVRYGCQVPTMGVAFMLMTPLLYTDVTDAWRLTSRTRRLAIDCAGIAVELAIACLATFLWAFLPDGAMRGVAFIAATTGWVVSLGLNLNPFMRFDGYYILSDMLGVENLQPRAFAIGKWQVRRILFAPRLPRPELMSPRLTTTLAVYAWMVWLYRLVVFTGIAVMVYAYFFKALGLVLFGVEIWYFILRPVVHEIAEWGKMPRQFVSRRRLAIVAGAAAAAILVFIVPWSQSVSVPAILEASDVVQVFPRRPARVVSLRARSGQSVRAGEAIAQLEAPELAHEIATTAIKRDGVRLRLARAAVEKLDREQTLVLTNELDSLSTKLEGLARENDELTVRAPVAGRIVEMDVALHVGRWLAKGDLIALIGPRAAHVVRGYVEEGDLSRVAGRIEGRFIPDDPSRAAIPVRVSSIAEAGTGAIEIAALASTYGGRIAVESDAQQRFYPIAAQYIVEMQPEMPSELPGQIVRGVVILEGRAESLAVRMGRQVLKVLLRESGF